MASAGPNPERPALAAIGTVIEPVPVAGVAANCRLKVPVKVPGLVHPAALCSTYCSGPRHIGDTQSQSGRPGAFLVSSGTLGVATQPKDGKSLALQPDWGIRQRSLF